MRRWLTGWPRNLGMSFFAGALLSGAFVLYAKQSSAKQAAMLVRGNKPGEWRYWGADAWSTRYSALDQINASQLRLAAGRVAVGRGISTATTSIIARRRSIANGRLLTVATTRRKAFAVDPVDGTDAVAVGHRRGHPLAEGAAPVRRSRTRVLDRRPRTSA